MRNAGKSALAAGALALSVAGLCFAQAPARAQENAAPPSPAASEPADTAGEDGTPLSDSALGRSFETTVSPGLKLLHPASPVERGWSQPAAPVSGLDPDPPADPATGTVPTSPAPAPLDRAWPAAPSSSGVLKPSGRPGIMPEAAAPPPAAAPSNAPPASEAPALSAQPDLPVIPEPATSPATSEEEAAPPVSPQTPAVQESARDARTAAEPESAAPAAPLDTATPTVMDQPVPAPDAPAALPPAGSEDSEQVVMPLDGGPVVEPFSTLSLIITAGAVALAIGMALWALWLGRNARGIAAQWRARFGVLEAKLDRAETIFNAQPDLVLVWDEDRHEPAGGFGRPKVLGNPATLATLLSYADGDDGATPVEGILYGLSRQTIEWGDAVSSVLRQEGEELDPPSMKNAKPSLVEAIQDLRWHGTTFSLVVKCLDGREIEVEGRPAGAQAVVWLTDVTAKGQGVNLLRDKLVQIRKESNELRSLLNAAPFPVWRRSSDLKLSWVNQAYADAVDLPSPDAAVEAEAELDIGARALTHQVQETGKARNEKHYVVINGERRAFDLIEMPHEGGIVGMALDITGTDDARQELQRHIDAHKQTLDKLATAVAIFGPDKKLQFYNQAYANLWKLDPAWLDTSPSDSEILDRLRETRMLPEQADFKAWKEHRLSLYTEVTEQPDELWHLPDSRHLRVACQPHPMGGLLFLYEDVTDRFRLESSLNTVMKVQKATLDNLSEGVAVFSSDGKMELHNKSFTEIWRLEESDLEQQPHFTRIVEWCRPLFDDDQEWMRMAERITSFNEERHPLTGRLDRNDGSYIDYAVLPLPNGATLLTCLDVTDTTRITQALRERNEALETADRLKSEFISHVSYQLRTPLTTIKGFAEMLESNMAGSLSTQQQEYSSAILEASNQLMVLMDDVLDLARIEAGVMALDLSDVDVFSVVSNVRAIAQSQADNANVTLTIEAGPRIGTIYADERRLRQILFNLVTNAISFTSAGGTVTIGAERTPNEVRLWVSDNGAGIDPQDQATVFDRFESKGYGGKRRGPGLGLSLVRSFVELHGGWVALESTPHIGTKVVCHMPISAQDEQAAQRQDKSAAE